MMYYDEEVCKEAMKVHYLDNSATTAVSPAAVDKAAYMMRECCGNPSSLHGMGLSAEREVELARERIADSLGVSSKEIIFTSGGTDSSARRTRSSAAAAASSSRRWSIPPSRKAARG